ATGRSDRLAADGTHRHGQTPKWKSPSEVGDEALQGPPERGPVTRGDPALEDLPMAVPERWICVWPCARPPWPTMPGNPGSPGVGSGATDVGAVEQRPQAGERRVGVLLVELAWIGLRDGPGPGEGAGDLADAAGKFERCDQLGVRGEIAEHVQVGTADLGQFGRVEAGREPALCPGQRDEHGGEGMCDHSVSPVVEPDHA